MTSKELLMGLDIGTSSIKLAVIDKNANVVYESGSEYRLYHENEFSSQIDTQSLITALLDGIKNSVKHGICPEDIKAIGISCLCPGLTAFDKNGNVLVDPIIYSDRRSTEEAELFNEIIGKERLFQITANSAMAGAMSGTSMLWIKRHLPRIYENTYCFGHVNTLVAYVLSGQFAIDRSNASYTLLFETAKKDGTWSEEICEKIGISIDKLPPVIKSTDVVGTLTCGPLLDAGFSADTKIVIGGGDTACASLATGVLKHGDVCESVGTTDVLTVCVDRPVFSQGFINRCHVVENTWIYQGAMSNAGSSYQWLYNNYYQDYKCDAAYSDGENLIRMNEDAARCSAGADGLVFLPYMMGERSPVWDAYARGVFFGVSFDTTRRQMNRAVLESCAYGLRQLKEMAEAITGISIKSYVAIGGGAKSRVWTKIKADVTGCEIKVLDLNNIAPVGAAMLAGVGCGIFTDVYDASSKLSKRTHMDIKPVKDDSKVYDRRFQVYTRLYPQLKELYRINIEM